jgi:hypothetical protein
LYANIALWRIAICSPILLAIRKSERDVDVSDLKRKFPENSRVKYIQQIDMLLHTGILFPNPHQPVFIPDPVSTCLCFYSLMLKFSAEKQQIPMML